MIFKFTDKPDCVDAKFQELNSDTVIDIEYIEFRKSSARKIEDILINGVKRDNQELVLDNISLSKENYQKLCDCRYKATFTTLVNIGGNTVTAVTFTLGNVDLRFDIRNVKFTGNDTIINLSSMTAYPFGDYCFEELSE